MIKVPTSSTDEYFASLKAVSTREKAVGAKLICGIDDDDDEDDDEHDDENETKIYTEAQISKLRHIVISKRRNDYLEKMMTELVGENGGFFTTSFSYEVMYFIEDHSNKASRKKTVDERFDYLLAITIAISEYDCWMYDHEVDAVDDLNRLLKKLSEAWKKILKLSNDELKIDIEFTRPGIEAFLVQFAEKIDNAELKFSYKHESIATQGGKRPSSSSSSSSSVIAASVGKKGNNTTSETKKRKVSTDPEKIKLAALFEKIRNTSLPPLPPADPDDFEDKFNKYSENAVYDSCDDVRKKSTDFLAKNSISKAEFLRELGNLQAKQWNSFMDFKGAGAGIYAQPGAGNCCYQKAYFFFEKMRIVRGENKTQRRIDFETAHPRGYSLKHDDGRRLPTK